mmetsp:Transcript_15812/g.39293  ORF Transcript_15812/g.39293 Transcript_15812/m.39293 type:complete len:385 (+) Transcript_15812:69-1223(+)
MTEVASAASSSSPSSPSRHRRRRNNTTTTLPFLMITPDRTKAEKLFLLLLGVVVVVALVVGGADDVVVSAFTASAGSSASTSSTSTSTSTSSGTRRRRGKSTLSMTRTRARAPIPRNINNNDDDADRGSKDISVVSSEVSPYESSSSSLSGRTILLGRRSMLEKTTVVAATAASTTFLLLPPFGGGGITAAATANAAETNTDATAATDRNSNVYRRQLDVNNAGGSGQKTVSYQIEFPPGMDEGSKPLKTHLDEVNFALPTTSFKVGITVDPVKITSLQEFGTPEEVAARVVTAEVNRDGIFEVTLLKDPYGEKDDTVSTSSGLLTYNLEYLSVGKRGNKHYMNKIGISPDQLLYVLTAQCKEDSFKDLEKQMVDTVKSFHIVV